MSVNQQKHRIKGIGISLIVTAVFSLLLVQALVAQTLTSRPVELSMTKEVSRSMARPGDQLQYTIDLHNTGTVFATDVVFTDSLPAEVDYIADSLMVTGGGDFGVNNNVITWTGHLNSNGGSASLVFAVQLTETLTVGQVITNTAHVQGPDSMLEASATTTIQEEFTGVYLPVIARPIPVVTLLPIGYPTTPDNFDTNQWTVHWTQATEVGVQYQLQESLDANFTNPSTYAPGSTTSWTISHSVTPGRKYYYRVRTIGDWGEGPWSNVEEQIALYADKFNDPNTGWDLRRQDTDDVDNEVSYRNGSLYVKIRGRWDYALASSLAAIPSDWEKYEIRTRVLLGDGVDNLHSHALIFGGDWNGAACPNSQYTSCFNHYYRLNVIWTGHPSKMRVQLKRIDTHDPDDNAGRGEGLFGYTEITVDDPDSWNEWKVRVNRQTGVITIYAGTHPIAVIHDGPEYVNNPYFGTMAGTDEYSGAAAYYDYYYVYPVP